MDDTFEDYQLDDEPEPVPAGIAYLGEHVKDRGRGQWLHRLVYMLSSSRRRH